MLMWNDPMTYTDPSGEVGILAVFGGAALVGAVANVASYAFDSAKSGAGFSLADAGKAAAIRAVTGVATAAAVMSGSAAVAVSGAFTAGAVGNAATQAAINGDINVGEVVVSGGANLIGAGTGKVASEMLETAVTTTTTKTSASGRQFSGEVTSTTMEKVAAGEIAAGATDLAASTAASQGGCSTSLCNKNEC